MNDQYPSKVEPYIVLTTVTDDSLANRLCTALEDAGISILMEHIDKIEDGEKIQAYRLLAPPNIKQLATRIISLHLRNHQTKKLITARTETYSS